MMKNKAVKFVFPILYISGFLGAGIIGLLSNSFFAYSAFDSLWSEILYVLFVALLFITAFVQEVIASRKISAVIINCFVFIGGLLFFLLLYFLSGVFTLFAAVYSAVMLGLVCFTAMAKVKKGTPPSEAIDSKQLVGAAVLILFPMAALLTVQFVNEIYMVWALIPAAVGFCAVGAATFVLLRKVWSTIYNTRFRRIANFILAIIAVFIISYAYSFVALGLANCIFDGKAPAPTECVVLNKKISAGARTPTLFEVKVKIANEEKWIPLPVSEYHEISEGSTIIVDYCYGAFNFAYLKYGGKN